LALEGGADLGRRAPQRCHVLPHSGSATSTTMEDAGSHANISAERCYGHGRDFADPRFAYALHGLVADLCVRHGLPTPLARHLVQPLGATVDLAWPALGVAVMAAPPAAFCRRSPREQAAALAAATGRAFEPSQPERGAVVVPLQSHGGLHAAGAALLPAFRVRVQALRRVGFFTAVLSCHDLYHDSWGHVGGQAEGGFTAPTDDTAAMTLGAGAVASSGPDDAGGSAAPLAQQSGASASAAAAEPHRCPRVHAPIPRERALAIVDARLTECGLWRAVRLHAEQQPRAPLS